MDDKRTVFRCPNELAWSLLSSSFNDCEVMNGMVKIFTYLTKDSQSASHSHLFSSSFAHFSLRIL